MDLRAEFDKLLTERNSSTTRGPAALDVIDGFLKEAYRINSHITSLHRELRDVRQAYLSTAQPRKARLQAAQGQARVLTDREREEVDANAKQMIRELNISIRTLDDAEQLRRETEAALIKKKYSSGLGALGRWASGGAVVDKTPEHAEADARAQQVGSHREGVVWYLRQQLESCCRTQSVMMKARLTREWEQSRSLLAQSGAASLADFAEFPPTAGKHSGNTKSVSGPFGPGEHAADAAASSRPVNDVSAEQLQMFEEGNQDMMKHFESSLDKVRTAEKSLREVSELQTLLVSNLSTQAAHIEQMVTDSLTTADNVGGGNQALKKATQRPSAARYTFLAASGLCAFLVVWDLLI